jgi:electron transport complex protein RnfE
MLINAYAFGLYQSLGIFIPLIVTNCIVVGRAEAFAVKNDPAISALDGFSIGMGATCAMFVLGSMREILGNGTLFDGADALLGGWMNPKPLSSARKAMASSVFSVKPAGVKERACAL